MPRLSEWFHRVNEIQSQVETMSGGHLLDRHDIEALFLVGPRRAIQLLHGFEGQRVGGALVLSREALLAHLRSLLEDPEYLQAWRRRQRVESKLEEARIQNRARQVILAPRPARLDLLPEGVSLEPGCLKVEFQEGIELLERLYELARSLASNFEEFEKQVAINRSVLFPE